MHVVVVVVVVVVVAVVAVVAVVVFRTFGKEMSFSYLRSTLKTSQLFYMVSF